MFLTTPRPPDSFTEPVVGLLDSVESVTDTLLENVPDVACNAPLSVVAVTTPAMLTLSKFV